MTFRRPDAASYPCARGEGLLVEALGDETVVYDLDTKEAHCLKGLAAVAFAYADGANSSADIAQLAGHRLGRPITEAEVRESLLQLQERGLLSSPPRGEGDDGVSRRDALRTLAAAGAGTMLITTVTAPVAAATSGGTSTCKALSSGAMPACFTGSMPSSGNEFYGCTPCSSSADCGSGYTCCCVHCDNQASYGDCCQSVCVPGHQCTGSNGYGGFSPLASNSSCPASYCLSYCTYNYQYKCCETSAGHCCSS